MTHNCTSSTVYVPRSISKGGGAVSGERYLGGRPDVASGSEEMSAGGAAAAMVEEVGEVSTTSSSAAPRGYMHQRRAGLNMRTGYVGQVFDDSC